jgi:hypothetical protein
MKKILLASSAFLAFSVQNAFAINLTFQFAVNSSSPSIYACNAGIRHPERAAICWDRSGNSCDPTTATPPSSCVCTGETGSSNGSWERDIMISKTADWVDNSGGPISTTDTDTAATNSSSVYNSLYQTDAIAYTKQITELTFNLASETYGSEYFVDVCYRGTQVAQANSGNNYSLKGNVTVTNLRAADVTAPNYQLIADLQGKADIKCYMDKNSNVPDTTPGSITYNYNIGAGSFQSLSTSATQVSLLTDATMNGSVPAGDKTPRFCIARYYFKENATSERKWKLQNAKAAIYTEISNKTGN